MRHLLVALTLLFLAACGDSPVGKYVFANKEIQDAWGFTWEFRNNGYYYRDDAAIGKWRMDKGVITVHLLDGTMDNAYEIQGDQLVSILIPGAGTLVRAD